MYNDNNNSNNNNNNNNNNDNNDDDDDDYDDDDDDDDDDNNNNNNNNNNTNNNNSIQRRDSRSFTISSLRRELSPSGQDAIACKSRATHRALITCNRSCYVPRDMKGQLSC